MAFSSFIPRPSLLLSTLALALGLGACDLESPPVEEADAPRGPLGKAELVGGSCQDGEQNFCGAQSAGSCWCDEQCETYGDCCSDKSLTCDGEAPSPGLCLFDEDCGTAEVCDHSECHSPECPEGFSCPAVCYGQCQPEPEPEPEPEPGALCLTDSACGAGFICDHSECHSPECPEGFSCPAVCFGECVPDLPSPGACESDADCAEDQLCGCAPCPDGFICPAVCIATCLDA